jgi:hypothetical protein
MPGSSVRQVDLLARVGRFELRRKVMVVLGTDVLQEEVTRQGGRAYSTLADPRAPKNRPRGSPDKEQL